VFGGGSGAISGEKVVWGRIGSKNRILLNGNMGGMKGVGQLID